MAGDVGVNLCGLAALVPQQRLDVAQVCALLQQVGGKGMPERVRRHLLLQPRLLQTVSEHVADTVGRVLPPILSLKQPHARVVLPVISPEALQ